MLSYAATTLALPKRLLYGPGPSMVEPRAYEAMAQPVVGIRDRYFLDVLSEVQDGLRYAFGTENAKTFVVPASGSGGMEAAVANFVEPGSKFLIFSAGLFAERIAAMGERQRAHVVRVAKHWGHVFSEDEAEEAIHREKPRIVAYVQAETSTGVYQSGRNIAPAARRNGALVMADCVTSLGALPVEMDAIGIDIAFSCSQKGLSSPAGLAPISLSARAAEELEKRKEDPFTWYLDLRLIAKYFEAPHVYHHTPSPPLYYALRQSLAAISEEGLQARWERHRQASARLVKGIERLGFKPYVSEPSHRTQHLTTAEPPAGVDEAVLRQRLLGGYNIEVAGGLGQLTGKILRIGYMGPLANSESIDFLLEALQACC